MRAYKCDRCGKLFANSGIGVDKIYITDINTTSAYTGIKDLCADCQNELKAWWTMRKEKEVVSDDT